MGTMKTRNLNKIFKIDYDNIMDLQNVTLEDCLSLYKTNGMASVINDGILVNFRNEKNER